MIASLVTLTTDFGLESPYVAAMKGALLSVNPSARLIDLSHQIPPQDIRFASYFLAASVPYFPAGTLHVIVVDPGVGTDRAVLYVELASQRLLAPDNGCLTALLEAKGPPKSVRRVQDRDYWRDQVSDTFHGRDIFAPVAGHLSLGLKPAKLGSLAREWIALDTPKPIRTSNGIQGEVLFIDHFGNLITNIPGHLMHQPPSCLTIGKRRQRRFSWVRTYGEAKESDLALLISSFGNVEVAVVGGHAAKRLGAAVGTGVVVGFPD
ncbi:MAG: S-adenosyl-l-methionine hydroxide adenosyltransferase family protein [Gemmataceae bacterium]